MVNTIPPRVQSFVKELDVINSEVMQMQVQQKNHEMSIDNISGLIKEYRANRNKKINIVMGNLMVEKTNKFAISHLQEAREQLIIAKKSVAEQIERKEDALESLLIKTYKALSNLVPKDVLDDKKEPDEGS